MQTRRQKTNLIMVVFFVGALIIVVLKMAPRRPKPVPEADVLGLMQNVALPGEPGIETKPIAPQKK